MACGQVAQPAAGRVAVSMMPAGSATAFRNTGRAASAIGCTAPAGPELAAAARAKPVDFHTALYQCGAQTPSKGFGTGRPGQHLAAEGNAERAAQRLERAARVGEHIVGIDDRRRVAQPVGDHDRKSLPARQSRCRAV